MVTSRVSWRRMPLLLAALLPVVLPVVLPVAGRAQNASAVELANTRVAAQIGALTAYGLKFNGQSVKIAVLDTGVNAAHPDLAGRIITGRNVTVATPNTQVADGNGHGTHVVGLIVANRNDAGMFGVAHQAQVIPVKVIANNGSGNGAWLDAGLRWAADQQSTIINLSLGSTTPTGTSALQYAIGKRQLIVVAAGNNGQAQPSWPARYASQPWANGQIINVVAVDASQRIAAWSNRAGDAMNATLAAPGVAVMSTYGNGYALMSGTSMATPVVSGAAALVRSRWNYLSARDVANILFTTATDLGAPGTDPIYGRGLVNVDKAMKPIGQVATPAYGGKSVPLYGASAGGALAGAMKKAANAGLLTVSGFDQAGRDFAVDFGASLPGPRPLSLDEALGADPLVDLDEARGPRLALGNAAGAVSIPHLSELPQAATLAWRLPWREGWSLTPALSVHSERASAGSLSLARRWGGDTELGATISQLHEQQTFLGTASAGVLGLGRASTAVFGVFLRSRVAPATTLEASWSWGSTPAAQGSLLSTSASQSQSMRVSLSRRGWWDARDRAAVVLEQPMRVSRGSLEVQRMVGADSQGAPVIERGSVDMRPDGRELRLGLHYQRPWGRGSLQLAALLRHQPGHFAQAPMERFAAIRYRAAF